MIKAFRRSTQRTQFCAIGSVKPNIGHLDRAAGVTGLIKATLALTHKRLPPSLDFQSASPDIDLADSPFYVNARLADWPTNGRPRRAGVSSFGVGGTNAHVVLEEAPQPRPSSPPRPHQLLLLSAKTETALERVTARLVAHLRRHPELNPSDVAYTLQVGRAAFAHRRVVVCRDLADAIAVLEPLDPRRVLTAHHPSRDRAVAFLLPGVGDHYAGMTQELYGTEPRFREAVDRCCEILRPHLGRDLRLLLYPGGPQAAAEDQASPALDLRAMVGRGGPAAPPEQPLHRTALAQPAVFVVEYALAQLLAAWGIRPQALLGYSLGEYVAACLAGVMTLEGALELVAARAPADRDPLARGDARGLPGRGRADTAAAGGGGGGGGQRPDHLHRGRRARGRRGAGGRVDAAGRRVASRRDDPRLPLAAAGTDCWGRHRGGPGGIAPAAADPFHLERDGHLDHRRGGDGPGLLGAAHVPGGAVRGGAAGAAGGARAGVAGGGSRAGVSSFAKQHPLCGVARRALVLPTLPAAYERQSELASLLGALGRLWLAGVTIDWVGCSAPDRRRLPLPTYPFERQRYWVEPVPQAAAGGPEPAWSIGPSATAAPTGGLVRRDLLDPVLIPRDAVPSTGLETEQLCWLLLVDGCGVGTRLAGWLAEQHQEVVTVSPGREFTREQTDHYTVRPDLRADYDRLLKDLHARGMTPTRVVHAWLVTAPTPTAAAETAFEPLWQRGFYSLLALTQALGDHQGGAALPDQHSLHRAA